MESNGYRRARAKNASKVSQLLRNHGAPPDPDRLIDVLSELRNLLDEYAPSWYTEKHHQEIESALHPPKRG